MPLMRLSGVIMVWLFNHQAARDEDRMGARAM
jgi:hypothetical protein